MFERKLRKHLHGQRRRFGISGSGGECERPIPSTNARASTPKSGESAAFVPGPHHSSRPVLSTTPVRVHTSHHTQRSGRHIRAGQVIGPAVNAPDTPTVATPVASTKLIVLREWKSSRLLSVAAGCRASPRHTLQLLKTRQRPSFPTSRVRPAPPSTLRTTPNMMKFLINSKLQLSMSRVSPSYQTCLLTQCQSRKWRA